MAHGSHKKAVLIDRIKKLQEDTQAAHDEIQELKEEVEDIVRENNALHIENQNLRARLEGLEEEEGDTMSPSKRNLERLYEDGFHVCNVSYGSRLLNDESCAFCLDVIYGKRE